ncbi:MAG: sugar phosphate isomerase/epimerase family protein, partial [Candidatus Bathyarchaeia archaeon]
ENGLKLGGWVLPVNFRGDEKTYRRDLEELPDYAEIAEELGCRRVFTWILPFSDELSFDENFEFHVERLRPVAEILEDHRCHLGLEFVGTRTVRVGHKYEFIYTMDGVLRLCKAIGTKNLGVLLDSWHWYATYGTLDQLRKLKGEQVIYVHINDAPAGISIEEQIDNVRCLPGETGVIDLVGFLKALKEIQYEGPVTPEPFSKKLTEMSVTEAVKLTGESLDKVWKEAGLS